MKTRLPGELQPQGACLARQAGHFAGRLAGHQDLAEVADGGAMCLAGAFDHRHGQAAAGASPGMGHPQHSAADDDGIKISHCNIPYRHGRARPRPRPPRLTYFFFGSDLLS